MKKILCLAVILFGFSGLGRTQSYDQETTETNRIQTAVDGFTTLHKYRLGVFRFRPILNIRAGADSNGRYGDKDSKTIFDVFVSATPGISGGLKFGQRAYLKIIEEVTFLYYFRLEERRDIFNATRAEFVTGTPGILFTFDAGYVRREEPVDEEVDVPVDHKIVHGGVRTEYSATEKIEMRHWFRNAESHYYDQVDPDSNVPPLRDRRTYTFGTGALYSLNDRVGLTANFHLSRSEALESGFDSSNWGLLGGMNFRKDKFSTHFGLGFGGTNNTSNDRKNFLMDAALDYLLGTSLRVGTFINRRQEFSSLDDQAVRVTTQGGLRASVPIISRISTSGTFTIGVNSYGNQPIGGQPVENDTFQRADFGINFRVFSKLSLRAGATYENRNTDIQGLTKDRFTYYFGFGVGYSIGFGL